MPVKLANGTLLQMLLCAGNVVTGRQISNDLLAHPTTLEDARLGVGEAPFQVGHRAGVGRLLSEVVWVLDIQRMVGAAYCIPALAVALSSTSTSKSLL